jgi:helix-turn-helix protein
VGKPPNTPTRWRLWIREDPWLDSKTKHVAHAQANYMDNETGIAYPSRQTLADDTGLSIKSIDRASRKLEEAGYLTGPPRRTITDKDGVTVERRPGGRCRTNVVRAAFPEQRHREALEFKKQRQRDALYADETASHSPLNSVPQSTKQRQGDARTTKEELLIELPTSRALEQRSGSRDEAKVDRLYEIAQELGVYEQTAKAVWEHLRDEDEGKVFVERALAAAETDLAARKAEATKPRRSFPFLVVETRGDGTVVRHARYATRERAEAVAAKLRRWNPDVEVIEAVKPGNDEEAA